MLGALKERILEPARLRELLAHVLEASDEANERRVHDLQQARAERTRAETAIGKLMELVETGLMSPRDPTVAKRFADHRTRVAALNDTIESLERQLEKGKRRITPEIIDRFGAMLREKLEAENPVLRKAYVRLIIGKVGLGNHQITICGSKLALEHALVRGDRHPGGVVPSFDREWCPWPESISKPMILISFFFIHFGHNDGPKGGLQRFLEGGSSLLLSRMLVKSYDLPSAESQVGHDTEP